MRPFVSGVIDALVERHGRTKRVDLNDIAEVIGTEAVSYDEVEAIITELERRGCRVGGEPSAREMALLGEVLAAARSLNATLGRRPTIDEIATEAGQPSFVVRRALENASSLGTSD
jgi:hypothetical protein